MAEAANVNANLDANLDLWVDEARAYAVVTVDGSVVTSARRGMSHANAMLRAEESGRNGKVAIVMHVVGDRSYEVDRYPAR